MLMRWKMEREAGLITAVYDKPGSGRVRRRRTLIGCSTERGGVGGGGVVYTGTVMTPL